jgi:hypothetical protein
MSEEVVAQIPHPISAKGRWEWVRFAIVFAVEAIKVPPLVWNNQAVQVLREDK